MKVHSKISHFNPQEVQQMARQLANLLQRRFHQQGDQGSAPGIFSVVGRGDGSLDDSYRTAEPGDDIKDYHLPLNSLRSRGGPFHVWTRANRFERRGVLLPDITGRHQPGSDQAVYEREDLAAMTTELLLRAAFQLGHKPGLVLPQDKARPRVVPPESNEGLLLRHLRLVREQPSQTSFETCLDSLTSMSANLEFAVVISDFLSRDWEKRLSDLARKLELVVFQIVDPWDLQLPNLGRVRIHQAGRTVIVNTRDPQARANYRRQASLQQQRIAEVLRTARVQHYQLTTTQPLLGQLTRIFGSSQSVRKVA